MDIYIIILGFLLWIDSDQFWTGFNGTCSTPRDYSRLRNNSISIHISEIYPFHLSLAPGEIVITTLCIAFFSIILNISVIIHFRAWTISMQSKWNTCPVRSMYPQMQVYNPQSTPAFPLSSCCLGTSGRYKTHSSQLKAFHLLRVYILWSHTIFVYIRPLAPNEMSLNTKYFSDQKAIMVWLQWPTLHLGRT